VKAVNIDPTAREFLGLFAAAKGEIEKVEIDKGADLKAVLSAEVPSAPVDAESGKFKEHAEFWEKVKGAIVSGGELRDGDEKLRQFDFFAHAMANGEERGQGKGIAGGRVPATAFVLRDDEIGEFEARVC
jgi:hypothetical protein